MHDESVLMTKLDEELKPLKEMCECLEKALSTDLEKNMEQVDTKEAGEIVDMIKDLYEAKEKIVKACYYKQIMHAMEKAEKDDEEEEKYLLRMFKEENKDEYKRMREQYGEEDGERRFYDSWRYSDGRFAPKGSGSYRPRSSGRNRRSYTDMMPMYHMTPEMYREHDPEYYRDMDRDEGRMYYNSDTYSGNMSAMSGNRSGNSGNSDGRRNYDGENRSESRDYREGRSGQRRKGYIETKEMHSENTPENKQHRMKELEKYAKELAEDVTEMIDDASSEEKAMLRAKLQTLAQKI